MKRAEEVARGAVGLAGRFDILIEPVKPPARELRLTEMREIRRGKTGPSMSAANAYALLGRLLTATGGARRRSST
jgi:hypothetical protein